MRQSVLAFAGAVALAASSGFSAQIVLAPANVIGGNGSYNGGGPGDDPFNVGQFNATNVLNQQTGPISEPNQSGFWLNDDDIAGNAPAGTAAGDQDAFIVIDLGQAYRLDQVELFNTHNAQFNDRGTGDFTITGANAVTAAGAGSSGSDISGPSTLLASGTLAGVAQADDPIDGQAFAVTDTGLFRYVRFDAETVATGGGSCCGANNYGLNEIRVSGAVPEPAGLSLLALGAAGLLGRRRRGA